MHQLVDAKGNGRQHDEEDDDDDGNDVVALCHGDGYGRCRLGDRKVVLSVRFFFLFVVFRGLFMLRRRRCS